MITKHLKYISLALAVFISGFAVSCTDNGMGTEGQTGTMEVQLTDAPANYDEVNVHINRVEVNDMESDTGWVNIGSPDKTYNLLELTNGATTVLGSEELPVGTYQQIRLILSADGHNVVMDGNEYDLKVPSGAQTGIKLDVDAEIEPDFTYELLLDFDASRSVVKRGNNNDYLLKPVVRAQNLAVTGNIAGTVEPVDAEPFVYAIVDEDTLSSTKADTADGSFKLIGLEDGTYRVLVEPTNDAYSNVDTTGVEVTVGETNEIGTITVPQN